jgi:CHAT domain-containing protein
MCIVRFILLSLLLTLFSVEAFCQSTENKVPTIEGIRQWFLVEGIRVDSYAFADTLESALKPQESNVPAKIQELESRLPHVYITEKRQIAKELVPLQYAYCQEILREGKNVGALLVNMMEWCYYMYLSDDPNYIASSARVCQMFMENDYSDFVRIYCALHEERLLQNPFIMLGDYLLEKGDFMAAKKFYEEAFPVNPYTEADFWKLDSENMYEIYGDIRTSAASRHVYKTLLNYPLYIYRIAKVAILEGDEKMFDYMNEAFLSAVDAIQWSLLQDDVSEHERLLELYAPIFKLQYGSIDPCWAYNAALFLKNASTYASLDLKRIYVDEIDLAEWGGYRANKAEYERFNGKGSYAAYEQQERKKLRNFYPYSNYQKYLDAKERTLKEHSQENIRKQAEIYENLLRGAFLYNGYLSSVKRVYKDVYEALPEGSCAVEFVTFDNIMNGEMEYLALVIRHDNPTPYRVRLCSESELRTLSESGADIYRPQMPVSQKMYDTVWSQIEDVTKDISTIYFAPDGLLMTINIESLCDPVTGLRFFEKKNVHRVSSTKQICLKAKEYELGNAVLYGGFNYGLSVDRMVERNLAYSGYTNAFRGYRGDGGTQPWAPLSGSMQEVNNIKNILQKKGIAVSTRTGDTATEEDFKSLRKANPQIIHIATHGFYKDNCDASEMKYYKDIMATDIGREYSPMRRSGLIFSGANNAWMGKRLPAQVEDGILLSEEIAAMDLSGTGLVVLSACETGLGEASSEGMSGLQKAFKRAGVDKLVISLGKVHDWATQQFMTTFYQYLTEGYDVYKSFQLARATMIDSETYNDASYWAPFILIE